MPNNFRFTYGDPETAYGILYFFHLINSPWGSETSHFSLCEFLYFFKRHILFEVTIGDQVGYDAVQFGEYYQQRTPTFPLHSSYVKNKA